MKCEVWRGEWRVESREWRVWSVEFGVWRVESVECRVWRVARGLWSVEW